LDKHITHVDTGGKNGKITLTVYTRNQKFKYLVGVVFSRKKSFVRGFMNELQFLDQVNNALTIIANTCADLTGSIIV